MSLLQQCTCEASVTAPDLLVKWLTAAGAYLTALSGLALAEDAIRQRRERFAFRNTVRVSIPLWAFVISSIAAFIYRDLHTTMWLLWTIAIIIVISAIIPLWFYYFDRDRRLLGWEHARAEARVREQENRPPRPTGYRHQMPRGHKIKSVTTGIIVVFGAELLLAAATLDLAVTAKWIG